MLYIQTSLYVQSIKFLCVNFSMYKVVMHKFHLQAYSLRFILLVIITFNLCTTCLSHKKYFLCDITSIPLINAIIYILPSFLNRRCNCISSTFQNIERHLLLLPFDVLLSPLQFLCMQKTSSTSSVGDWLLAKRTKRHALKRDKNLIVVTGIYMIPWSLYCGLCIANSYVLY